jgi:ubiquitin carboxyl-terminal hydrolase 10
LHDDSEEPSTAFSSISPTEEQSPVPDTPKAMDGSSSHDVEPQETPAEEPIPAAGEQTNSEVTKTTLPSDLIPETQPASSEPVSAPASTSPAANPPAPKVAPKSWAALLRDENASNTSSTGSSNQLPVSRVVGISVPAVQPGDSTIANAQETIRLLNNRIPRDGVPHITPRGLINLGNMCFANTILQVLLFSQPFWRLFEELGRLQVGPLRTRNGCPLLDAT